MNQNQSFLILWKIQISSFREIIEYNTILQTLLNFYYPNTTKTQALLENSEERKGKKEMSGNSDAATDAGASGAAAGPIFETEAEMLQHLVETMGMPKAMLDTLTTQQKTAMFEMSKSRAILTQAHERIDHEEGWKHCHDKDKEGNNAYDYEWKNTRDDVFMKIKPPKHLPESAQGKTTILCKIQKDHLRIWTVWSEEAWYAVNVVLVDRQLFQSVNVNESTWKVAQDDGNDMVVVSLRKAQIPMRWLAPYR